jgi:hypothetical protein
MAIAAVTTDLSQAYDGTNGELTTSDATTNFSEPTGSGGTSGETYADLKSYAIDTEFKLQGTGAIGGAWTTNGPERGGVLYNYNGATVPTDGAILVWMWFIAPTAISAYSIGGLWVATGSATSALNIFRVSGNDFDPAPKGGWYCFAVDPAQTAERYEQVGSPTTTINYVGGGVACTTAMSRGLTHLGIDAIRIGRCRATITGGTSTDDDATFDDVVDLLEAQGNGSFGIFELQGGSYFMQGLLQIGDGTNECDFTDSNKTINIRNTPAVGANFNKIEIQNGSSVASNVSLTSCNFANLGVGNPVASTASRGDFVVTDPTANVSITSCAFIDMGTFTFGSASAITGSTFRRCDIVATGGGSVSGGVFDNTVGTWALQMDGTRTLSGTTFVSADNGEHAIYIDETGTYTITDCTFTNYDTTNGGSNTVIYNNSGGAVTINVSGNTGTISYTNGTSASTSVQSSSTINIHVQDEAKTDVASANVYINDDDSGAAEVNTTTDANGDVSTSYSGSATTSTLRVRKYGFKPFKDEVDLSADINRTITLVADPQQT